MSNASNIQIAPAFRFVVSVDGEAIGAFTECALPTVEWETEEIKEGGLNTFVHQLPGRRKSSKITLKNGVGVASNIVDWYIKTLNENISRRQVTIELMNNKREKIMTWDVENAYPTKWTGPQLKAADNTIAIQELELACGEVTVTQSSGQGT